MHSLIGCCKLCNFHLKLKFFSADDDCEDFGTKLEAELTMMDVVVDVTLGDGRENLKISQNWARPDLPPFNPKTGLVIFQQIDVDHYNGEPMTNMSGAQVR